MKYLGCEERKQKIMFPDMLDDYVEPESPVRLFDKFVNTLDFAKLGFLRSFPAKEGRPGYDPRDLMKLYIYGYFNNVRSSRRLERECKLNYEMMWLMKKLKPDFRTISDFRKNNKENMKKVFKEFNKFCYKLGLFSLECLSIDGSKFVASNSKDNNFTASKLDDRLERINKHIAEYMKSLDSEDGNDEALLKKYEARKAQYKCYQKNMQEEKINQISLTDPDAKLMKMKDGFGVCYNTQTAVNTASHLVAGFEITNSPTDHGQLTKVAKKVKEDFGSEESVIETIADKGYQSEKDMAAALENGIVPNVIPKLGKTTAEVSYEYKETEIDDKTKSSTKPDDLKKCLEAGVVPDAYKDILEVKEIKEVSQHEEKVTDAATIQMSEEEMLEVAKAGCFVRNAEKNCVYCPAGSVLRQKAIRKNGDIRFFNKLACKNCKTKCTKCEWKEIDFGKDQLIKKFDGKGTFKSTKVKKEKGEVKTKVIYTLKLNMAKLKKRMSTSEHPFGTVKRALSGYYFLLRRKPKVEAEMSLLFLAYNIKRAINILGISKIMSALA